MIIKRETSLKPLSGRANFTWNLAGKVIYAASRAMTIILIAKIGNAEMVGQYALALAVTTPIFMLADLDLRSVLVTDSLNRLEFGYYLGLRVFTTALAYSVTCIFAILQTDPQVRTIILLAGFIKCIETSSDMFYGLIQKAERLDKIGISQILNGILSILLIWIILLKYHSITAGLAGVAAALLGVLIFYDIRISGKFTPVKIFIDAKIFLSLIWLSLPLGMVMLINSLNKNITNYFIEAFLGFESLGYFSSMVYIMAAGNLVVTALNQSRNVRMARFFSEGNKRGFMDIFYKMLIFVIALGVCMLFAGVIAGEQILAILFKPEYALYNSVFVTVLGAAGISYLSDVVNYSNTAMRQFRLQPLSYGTVLLAGLLLNSLLVPALGLIGAALCLLITSCLQLAGNSAILIYMIRKKAGVSDRTKEEPEIRKGADT